MISTPPIFRFLLACLLCLPGAATWADGWRAGVSRTIITPKQPLWLAGYASRTHAADGKLHELWAKALVLEDADKKQVVLITTDLLGFPKAMSDRIREQLRVRYKLGKDQIVLSSSHTHSGPVLGSALSDIYEYDEQQQSQINTYSGQLEKQLVDLVGTALRAMEPVEVSARNGVTRFQVNRRANKEASLLEQTELQGPNDFAVPVLKIVNAKGQLKAITFGYACHPTVLDLYQWSGDYAGFAQLELEKAHPGATALFFQGAAGDLNPLPRRTISLARQYGRELAAAVDRVLDEPMRILSAQLKTRYTEIPLPLAPPPSATELATMSRQETGYLKRWAVRMLADQKAGRTFITAYPYPVQVWQLGDQTFVCLGGEITVEYALALKKQLGPDTFVLGYCNDLMGYIPSETILREGGYEGATSQMVYGLPGLWAPGIQDRILQTVAQLLKQSP